MSDRTYRVVIVVVLILICAYWLTRLPVFGGAGAMLFFIASLIQYPKLRKERKAKKWAAEQMKAMEKEKRE